MYSASNEWIKLLRPWQWIKNLFVFLPMFFSGMILDITCWISSIYVFVVFCMASSSIYCLNDCIDKPFDINHPEKKLRPVAAGTVKVSTALFMFGLLSVVSLISAILISTHLFAVVFSYLIIFTAYCLGIKRIPVVDAFVVGFGFVLRVVAGGVACDVWLSQWIICMTFLLSLLLAFGKRRSEMQYGTEVRTSMAYYDLTFLNLIMGVIGAVTMVCYIMYTMSSDVVSRWNNDYVYVSSIFVLAALIRYLQLSIVENKAGDPTMLFVKDRFIQWCMIGWILTFFFIIYL